MRVPQKLRFYGVGEYGGKTFRPHYHVGLFNFANCERDETLKSGTGRCLWERCCGNCRLVGDIWGKGDIEIRDLDAGKCEYLSGYIAQKRVRKSHAELFGLQPEFSLSSRGGRGGVGGIGVGAVSGIAATIAASLPKGALLDVPGVLHHGKDKKLFLDRYMKQKLRECFELEPDEELAKARWKEQVFPVCAYARGNGVSLKEAFKLVNQPYEEALLARQKRKGKI